MGLKYSNILVAIDGSKEADWAFKKGIEIAKREASISSVLSNFIKNSFIVNGPQKYSKIRITSHSWRNL